MREAGARRAKWSTAAAGPATGWASLTDAERRVATLISEGHTNKSAASALDVSINTVGTHLRAVFAKLGVQSRVQLANCLASYVSQAQPSRDGGGSREPRAWIMGNGRSADPLAIGAIGPRQAS
jgi:DNA-binding CsgD family transcriptional regulator